MTADTTANQRTLLYFLRTRISFMFSFLTSFVICSFIGDWLFDIHLISSVPQAIAMLIAFMLGMVGAWRTGLWRKSRAGA